MRSFLLIVRLARREVHFGLDPWFQGGGGMAFIRGSTFSKRRFGDCILRPGASTTRHSLGKSGWSPGFSF